MWRGAEGSEGSLVWPQPSLGLQPLCNGVTLPSRTLPLSLPLSPQSWAGSCPRCESSRQRTWRRGAERSLPDTARPEIETRGHELNTLQSLLCLQQEVQLRPELSSAWMGTGVLTWAGRAGVLLCWCQQEQLCGFPLCPLHSVGCLDNAPRSGWAVPPSKHPTVACQLPHGSQGRRRAQALLLLPGSSTLGIIWVPFGGTEEEPALPRGRGSRGMLSFADSCLPWL